MSSDPHAEIERERDKYRGHSVILNSVAWRISEALGKVGPGDNAIEGDVEADLTELLAALREAREATRIAQEDADALYPLAQGEVNRQTAARYRRGYDTRNDDGLAAAESVLRAHIAAVAGRTTNGEPT